MNRTTVLGIAAIAAAATAHAAPALTTIPALRHRLTPQLAGVGRPGHIALTFDDGPDRRSTPQFLTRLAEANVTATFFLLGSMLHRDPGLGPDLIAAGHEVAVHGWTHHCLLGRTHRATVDDITRARDHIGEATGSTPRFYRPPYGVLTTSAVIACHRLNLTPRLWTAWGRDWRARTTPGSILRTVTRTLTDGGTVLLHDSDCTSAPDSWRATLAALPRLLDWAAQHHLTIGPLREHAVDPGADPLVDTLMTERLREGINQHSPRDHGGSERSEEAP
jgi:peptidoglycan/xylan/chitin deacetylase (PgdA/CDA1 family)